MILLFNRLRSRQGSAKARVCEFKIQRREAAIKEME